MSDHLLYQRLHLRRDHRSNEESTVKLPAAFTLMMRSNSSPAWSFNPLLSTLPQSTTEGSKPQFRARFSGNHSAKRRCRFRWTKCSNLDHPCNFLSSISSGYPRLFGFPRSHELSSQAAPEGLHCVRLRMNVHDRICAVKDTDHQCRALGNRSRLHHLLPNPADHAPSPRQVTPLEPAFPAASPQSALPPPSPRTVAHSGPPTQRSCRN